MVNVTREEIVAKAREYFGTRWTHKGRVKGVGVDCAGLVVCVYSELGFDVVDNLDYSGGDEIEMLLGTLRIQATERTVDEMKPGDVVVFRNTKYTLTQPMLNHVGIVTADNSFIHSWSTPSAERVVETPFNRFWTSCIVGVFGFS